MRDRLVPMLMHDVGELDLEIGVRSRGSGVPALLGEEGPNGVKHAVRCKHHAGEGLTDDGIKCDQEGKRDQRPEAAGHRVDALFAVKLLHLLIEFLLVALVAALQLLNLGLQAGLAHHALLALGLEGREDQVDDEREEQDRRAVVPRQVIQPDKQPREGPGNDCPHRIVSFLHIVFWVFTAQGRRCHSPSREKDDSGRYGERPATLL